MMRRQKSTSTTILGLAFLILGAPSLVAASFTVAPVRVEFSRQHLHTTLQVTNNGDEAVTVQLHPVLWELKGNQEAEQDTDDLIFNPPVFSILPHQTQAIRIGLRQYTVTEAEQTYRLILEEVPPAPGAGTQGLRTVLRISIPMFVKPGGPAAAKLSWTLGHSADGMMLSVENHGNAHIQIKRLSLSSPDGTNPIVVQSGSAYVLPGGRKEWIVKDAPVPGQGGFLMQAITDGNSVTEILTLAHP